LDVFATAVYDFGLHPDVFLSITPAQFHAIGKRYELHQAQSDYRSGIIASIMYNIHRGDSAPMTPADFFQSLQELRGDEAPTRPQVAQRAEQTGEEMLAHMLTLKAFGSQPLS